MEEDFDFGHALFLLKLGKKVARYGWNGKDMWLVLAYQTLGEEKDTAIKFNKEYPDAHEYLDNFIVMKTAKNHLVPWLASQTDILANDWFLMA